MRHPWQTISLALFAVFLLAPAATLMVDGPAAPFVHGRAAAAWPTAGEILAPRSDGRTQLADALLDRLALRREAIRLKNAFTFRVLGYADTERVVSGAPGWLFYKPALAAWRCDQHARLDHGLRRLMLLVELAEANAIPMVIANAPNKASIQPERLAGRATHYAECYGRYAARYRAALDRIDSKHLVDHARTLSAATREGDAYHPTDTHWTLVEAYRAIETLARTTGWYAIPADRPDHGTREKSTDLGDQILLLDERSPTRIAVPPAARPTPRDPKRRVLLVHDSFYAEATEYLDHFLVDAARVNVNRPGFRQVDYAGVDALIIESVEREILRRVRSHAHFSWFSPAGRWMQARMAEATERCDWMGAEDLLDDVGPPPSYEGLERGAGGVLVATGDAPKLYVGMPASATGRAVCLSLEVALDAEPQPTRAARIFLDGRAIPIAPGDPAAEFGYGRTVELRYGRDRTRLAFVVPPTALDRRIRIDWSALAPGTRLVALRRAEARAD